MEEKDDNKDNKVFSKPIDEEGIHKANKVLLVLVEVVGVMEIVKFPCGFRFCFQLSRCTLLFLHTLFWPSGVCIIHCWCYFVQ